MDEELGCRNGKHDRTRSTNRPRFHE
jgi:hypothetical protein